MPSSSAAAAFCAAEMPRLPPPPLPLLQQHISGLGFRDHGLPAGGSGVMGVARQRAGLAPPPDSLGEPRLGGAGEAAARGEGDLELEEEDEEDHLAALLLLSTSSSPSQSLPLLPALGSVLLSPALDEQEVADGAHDPEGMMAAMLSHAYGGGLSGGGSVGLSGEQTALLCGKSVNTTECVPVPSSDHVAEIVGRQGCKIKALRAKTNTYIKTPVRGEEPVFVVTGRKEDVAMAKMEILSAAEHFSMIRASRNKSGPALGGLPCTPNLPGQMTVQVRVPYRVVGLVVGPKGATIKRIQQQTHTYIVTPSRDKEPVFEVTGMPENVNCAREEIEMHIAMRTGNYIKLNKENDFHYNGTDVSFEGGTLRSAWLASNPVPFSCTRMISNYRNDSSSSLGSSSTDSCFGSNRLADFSPTSPFSTSNFWFGETLPSVGTEDLAVDSPVYDSLSMPSQTIWTPFEPVNPLPGFGSDPAIDTKPQYQGRQPSTPCLSPTFPESPDHPLAGRANNDPPSTGHQVGLPIYIPAFSNGTNSYSSSNGGSTSSSPPESRQKLDCMMCFENQVVAALVPCGHNLFCLECANKICEKEVPSCPVCQTAVTQAIQIDS
ncbi:RNA-binding E3 ubiquitin-protein ligase MEX3C isoform X1 [Serinus canaria]|nr:RNA-binding E3 ubiquitin-protein ligase MEX3C isoform X1 [Serinus canaria]